MRLNNKYRIGCLVQFYELEMLPEHIKSCIGSIQNIDKRDRNKINFDFCFSTQTHFEHIDYDYFKQRWDIQANTPIALEGIFLNIISELTHHGVDVTFQFKRDDNSEFYNIAAYRRDFCWYNAIKCDLVGWGETDSLWPKETFQLLEALHTEVREETPKYIVNFADRVLWDNSFAPVHPKFKDVKFVDTDDWQFNNIASGKSYMNYEQMCEINDIDMDSVIVESYDSPRFDGSCVFFSSELLKSGVTLPQSLIHNSEDVSLGKIAKKLLGDKFVQYNFSNILHVHNRRHPKKRTGILNENNPMGLCSSDKKGVWWDYLERFSKHNFYSLFNQDKSYTINDVYKALPLD